MAAPIVSQDLIRRMYRDAAAEMSEDAAVLLVASATGYDPVVIESVLWGAESRHLAGGVA